jgi:hypothetical protein
MRTSSIIYSAFGVPRYDEAHIPALPSSPHNIVDEIYDDKVDVESWEFQADAQRTDQEKLWDKECDEREKQMASTQLMLTYGASAQQARRYREPMVRDNPDHDVVQIQPPATNLARSQKASVHSERPSDPSNTAIRVATYEQQTGIIRDQSAPVEVEEWDRSSTSSLRRRGAVRRKTNPMFSRPTYEDFDQRRRWSSDGIVRVIHHLETGSYSVSNNS